MAHYALLDENNIVINVITGVDENVIQTDLDGTQVGGSTEAWETFYALQSWLNAKSCKRTSYNDNIRKKYAAIGDTYDAARDAFIAPKPFNSWVLDEDTCRWQAPSPKPEGFNWTWDEENLMWQQLES